MVGHEQAIPSQRVDDMRSSPRESLGQDVVQRRAFSQALPKFLGFRAKLVVRQFLELRIKFIDVMNQRPQPLHLALVLRTKTLFSVSN